MPYYSASAQYWYLVKKVGVVPARSRKSCIVQAVRQVVFTDVLIVGRLDMDGQSFAPIGLHKIDAASDWLLKKRHCIGRNDLPEVPERGCFISTKNQRCLRKIQKPVAALVKAYICQFLAILSKSISWDSTFKYPCNRKHIFASTVVQGRHIQAAGARVIS